jgi:phospholipid/cholesterol/gamma-HCH transport system substrate-binding protein
MGHTVAMKRTDRVRWGELRVGILVALALLFLLWASFSGGGTSIFYAKYELKTIMKTANGLMRGAPVRLSGVEVGKVSEIRLVGQTLEQQVFVSMMVEERIWPLIKSDSRATLGTIGMLGDKYIELTPGTPGLPDLEPGATVEGHVAGDLLTIIDKAPDMLANLQDLSDALGGLARKLKGTDGTVGQLVHSDSLYNLLVTTGREAAALVTDLKREVPALTRETQSTLTRLNALADRAEDTTGSLGQLLGTRDLYDRVDRITARLDTLSADLNAGEGTVGALLKDEAVYEDLHKTILDLQFLLQDIRENPKKYVTFKLL